MTIFGINLTASNIWLLGVCGILIMALIHYRLKINAQKQNTFNIAAANFRSKLLSEIEGLYPIPVSWPGNIEIEPFLRSKFPKIQSAVEEFKVHLPSRVRKKFIKAWIAYYSGTGAAGYQCYHHYMPFISTYNDNGKQIIKDTRDTCRETFRHNIDRLLSFAEQK
jgi:hypothetical protein